MSEYRRDPVCGYWVVVAEERAGRPREFTTAQPARTAGCCPFCKGNEAETPGEVFAVRRESSVPDGPGWRMRVVPNKYPALSLDQPQVDPPDDLYARMPGLGVHELLIESPDHTVSVSELGPKDSKHLFALYRDRLVELKKDRRLVHALIFKNVRPAAGATIEHAHSHLIATPMVPGRIAQELAGSRDYHNRHNRCIYCAMVEQELRSRVRIAGDWPHFVAFCPFASRVPLETWIVPKDHASGFENTGDEQLAELSQVVKDLVARLERVLDGCAYNYLIHSAPFDTANLVHYHWHVEVIPRTTVLAGFEWGSGFYINPVSPEKAAAMLKKSCQVNGESRSGARKYSD